MEGTQLQGDPMSQSNTAGKNSDVGTDPEEQGDTPKENAGGSELQPPTSSLQLTTSFNIANKPESQILSTELLLEQRHQMQQMYTNMTMMMQSFNEGIDRLCTQRNMGDSQTVSTPTKRRAHAIGDSELTTDRESAASPLTNPLELETPHQGECGSVTEVFTNLTKSVPPSSEKQKGTSSSTDESPSPTISSGRRERDLLHKLKEKEPDTVKELLTTIKFSNKPLPTFSDGTCAEYWAFRRAFLSHVRDKEVQDSQRLEYLVSAYSGPAKEEICGCQELEDASQGYKEAWTILETRHGNKRKYVKHLARRILRGPDVMLEDITGLRRFVDDLSASIRNLKIMRELAQIDTYEAVRMITERFKGKLKDEHQYESHKYEELSDDNKCGAEWLLTFTRSVLTRVEKEDNETEKVSERHTVLSRNPSSTSTKKVTGLTTTTSEVANISQGQCSLCQEHHRLEMCNLFLDMSNKDRFNLLRRERRCLSCLMQGHWMANCDQKMRCGIAGCQEHHSRLLHNMGGMRQEAGPTTRYTVAPQGNKRAYAEVMSIQELPYPKRPRQNQMRALMPPRPHTSNTNPQTHRFKTKNKRGDNTTLVTAAGTDKTPYRWVRNLQTGDEGNDSSVECSDYGQ